MIGTARDPAPQGRSTTGSGTSGAPQLLALRNRLADQIAQFEQVLRTIPEDDLASPEVKALRVDIEERRVRLRALEDAVLQGKPVGAAGIRPGDESPDQSR